jgi:hypothetical protein
LPEPAGSAGAQFRQTNVPDLLDHVLPVDRLVQVFAGRQAAQQGGLVFGPGEHVALIQLV